MLSQYKFYSEPKLSSLARKLSWVNPNILTTLGIIPYALFFIFMKNGSLWAAFLCLIFSPIDMLDGAIARANGKVSAFGGFWDSTLDRVSDFLLIAGLYAGGLCSLELASVLFLASYLISYTRSRGELADLGQTKFDVGLIERPERIAFILVTVGIAAWLPQAKISGFSLSEFLIFWLTVFSIYTFGQRVAYAYKNLNKPTN